MSALRAHALGLLLGLALATTAEAQDVDRFTGLYRFAGGATERTALERAVDQVCHGLDPLTRLVARPQLVERNLPVGAIRIESAGDRHAFVIGPWGPVRVRLGEPSTVRNERGEQVVVVVRWERGRLWYIRRTDRGVRTDALHLDESGRVLTVDSVIESPFLPVPLRFRLTYRREH